MSGMERQLLTPGLLRDLQSLNLRFLDLLGAASCTGNETGLVHGLPAPLAARIGAMDSNQLREIAACPCTLFSVQWPILVGDVGGIADAFAEPAVISDPRRFSLVNALVVFAAQLSRTQPLVARIILGCRDRTVKRLSGITVGLILDRLAAGNLQPRARYLHNRRFWPDLVDFAECGDTIRLPLARSLAVQLSVQDACRTSLARNSV